MPVHKSGHPGGRGQHSHLSLSTAGRKANEIQFLKNTGLVGGLVLVLTRPR
jgi:hypothetical protein